LHWLGTIILLVAAAYGLGFRDGYKGRPPEPLRGTYDSGEHEDRVDDYPEY
jgi:hypothetical protein